MQLEKLDNGDLRWVAAEGAAFLISLYESDLVRVRYWPAGSPDPTMLRTWSLVDTEGGCPLEGHDRGDLDTVRRFSRPSYTLVEAPDSAVITCGGLRLRITAEPFSIVWSTEARIAADNPLIAYHADRNTGRIAHTLTRYAGEHYYGFGEAAGPLDKQSRLIRMRNTDAFGYDAETSGPLYKHIPFYITLMDKPPHASHDGARTEAFGIFYDTPYDCEFDMGSEIDNYYGDYRVFRAAGGDLDYYLMLGPSIERVIEQYTALTGRVPLPPRWTLGYLGSAMRYTDAPNAQQMLGEFIAKCQQNAIPCSGFHMSSGYTMAEDGRRYVFTWNRDRVPDPQAMTAHFHANGMRLAANIKPAMLNTHPRFSEAQKLFIRAADADTPDLSPFWGGYGAHLDFTNRATIAWWKQNVKAQLLDYGIDSTWNDNNEFNVRDGDARCDGFGQPLPIAALKPIQTTLMVMASFQAQAEYAPERRPWLLTRAGGPGIQRYAATWTGDNRTAWKTLQYNIPMGIGLGLSGLANIGHDIGGFAGDPPEPELMLRWIQNGIFHPRFCIHSWRTDEGENAPWMYPEILPEVWAALRFRYSLIPYLYTLLREASETGHPVIRPTVYHFQDDPICHTQSFDFMVGPSLLVPSVLDPGARSRMVYLPRGAGWYDWYSGAYFEGGQTITLAAPLDHSPLLVREGGMIPLEVEGRRQVHVFPHRADGEGRFALYEDDGETMDYRRGAYQIIDLRMTADAGTVRLAATAEVEWVVPPGETRLVVSG